MALKKVAVDPHPRPNIFLYGPPKTGKTMGACSAPGEVALINADTSDSSYFAHQKYGARLTEYEFEGLTTFDDVRELVTSKDKPDVVVFDNVPDMYRRVLLTTTGNALRPSLPKRGDVTTYLDRFFRDMCEAPVAVVIVAHELVHEPEGEGRSTRYLPATGTSKPGLGLKLAGMVSIVGYTARIETEEQDGETVRLPEPKYVAQLVEAKGRIGGHRYGSALGYFEQMELTDWFDRIEASQTAATEPQKETVK